MKSQLWERNHTPRVADWLSAHWLTLLRAAVTSALLVCAGTLAWQLLNPFIKHPRVEVDPYSTANNTMVSAPRSPVFVARIQDEHLFGDTAPAAAAASSSALTESGSVSVIGIIYSTEATDSVALLSVAGNAVVSHVGTQLPSGRIVAGIMPDRVELNGRSGSVNLLLDIKQADPNQRIQPGAYATLPGPDGTTNPSLTTTAQSPVGPSTPQPAQAVSLAPTHFVSLQSIRGKDAEGRIQNLDAPIVQHRLAPPQQ